MKLMFVALALIAFSGFTSAKPATTHEDNLLNTLLQQEVEDGGGGGRRANRQDEGDDGVTLQEDDDDDDNNGRVSEQDEGDEGDDMMQGGGEEGEDTDAVAKLKADLKAALLQEGCGIMLIDCCTLAAISVAIAESCKRKYPSV